MATLQSNTQRGLNAVLLLWINLGLAFLGFISAVFQYYLIDSARNGNSVSTNLAEASDMAESLIAIINLIAYIISIVFFIMWFRRAYRNLHQLTGNLSYTEGWAAGAWFVPILSLFRPYQIMKEMYDETDTILTQTNNIGSSLKKSHLPWWWILGMITGQLVFRFSRNTNSIDDVHIYTVINLIDAIVNIPLTLLAIKVVKEYAFIEPELVSIQQKMNEQQETDSLFTESEYRRYLDHSE